MHIYIWQIDSLQSSIDALNTATLNLVTSNGRSIYIEQCTIYLWQIDATPSHPINHRCLENITPNKFIYSTNTHIPMAN